MTSNKEMSDPTTKQARRRKVAAVLAGGLVLGVGTMATLASWNDSEFANATFKAGTFNMEGAVDSLQSSFSEHPTATPGALGFTTTFTNMQPGDTVYAPFALRLDKFSTYAATVAVSQAPFTGASAGLTYSLYTTAAAGCSTATPGTPLVTVVPAGTAINSVGTPTGFSLAKPVTAGSTPGTTTFLCFKVTADAALQPSLTSTPTWNFTATSGVS